jgi:hypothetical protein
MAFKFKTYILLFILMPVIGFSQAERLMINSGYVVMANGTAAIPTYLVIHNGASNAITRTAGGIISEAEFNMIWWDIGTNASTYTIPFQYSNTNYIPLTFNNTGGPGVANGSVLFSTYHGTNAVAHGCTGGGGNISDNLCYVPSDVTNMYPATSTSSPTATDDSYYVVDRFWIIDPTKSASGTPYTTVPNPIISFSYVNGGGGTEVAGSNVAGLDGTLIAQRFNNGALKTWGDWMGPTGFDNTAFGAGTGQVTTNTQIGTSNFFRSWTLSDHNAPLPIQLVSFNADCDSGKVLLKWVSATETSNDFYTIDRSSDGVNFQTVAKVKGAGTSSTPNYYSCIDYSPLPGTSYYRISQTDFDGNTTIKDIIPFTECGNNPNTINAYNANGVININANSTINDNYIITLYNVLGQQIINEYRPVLIGNNTFKLYPNVSSGVYILNIKSDKVNYNKKLFIGR